MNGARAIIQNWGKKSIGVFAVTFIMSLFFVVSGYALERDVDGENSELVKNSIFGNDHSYQFVGGAIVAGSFAFTIDRLKYGKHMDFERLVFCVYDTLSTDSTYLPSNRPPRYAFALSPDKKRAELRITAYNSKVDEAQLNRMADSGLIEKVAELKVCDWRWYFIFFKEPVDIEVFDLSDPGRIVLDISPGK